MFIDGVPVVLEKDITGETPKQAGSLASTEADIYDRTKEGAVTTTTPSEKGHRNRRGSHEHLVKSRCDVNRRRDGGPQGHVKE